GRIERSALVGDEDQSLGRLGIVNESTKKRRHRIAIAHNQAEKTGADFCAAGVGAMVHDQVIHRPGAAPATLATLDAKHRGAVRRDLAVPQERVKQSRKIITIGRQRAPVEEPMLLVLLKLLADFLIDPTLDLVRR